MPKIFDYTMECDLNKSTIFISLGLNVSQHIKAKVCFYKSKPHHKSSHVQAHRLTPVRGCKYSTCESRN